MKKIAELAQDLLLTDKRNIAIDFTCGQGFDTLFLGKHYEHVVAFDIQEDAIKQSQQRITEQGLFNVEFHQVSHDQFDEYVASFDAGIFNLGYLPHGDSSITTQGNIVITALEKGTKLLTSKGKIVVVCYPGFNQGLKESEEVEKWLSTLPSKEFDVVHISLVNRKSAPYILVIEKH
ncbi:MAG: class I SAM-dependent methyltransferase [Erysipelotrichales bacterium]|nr:class I SAM-dependent methyltransferase [Erysipelotrichales bacterium]